MENCIVKNIQRIDQLVNKEIYLGKMSIMELKDIVKYTNRISNPNDPFESDQATSISYQYYQRIKNSDRAYDIKMFFLKNIWNRYNYENNRISPLGTFPSSIIIAFDSYESNDFKDFSNYMQSEPKPESVFIDEKKQELLIPKNNQGLIVDGQHRIAGLEVLLEEAERRDIIVKKSNKKDYYTNLSKLPYNYIIDQINNFQFIISYLIDFDLYEQSEIFATVNFNQQKVNKSFYYDIFGSASSSKTIEKLLHDITSHLNYKSDSPLFHKIKMLGSGEGYFSQAFFVDALIPHFRNGAFQFVYSNFQDGGEEYKKITNFLKQYFRSIFSIYSDFLPEGSGKKYPDILLKTTGMGAIIKLMPIIFNAIKSRERISDSKQVLLLNDTKVDKIIKEYFSEVDMNGEEYFGENGDFSKGSGKGLQNKLFEKINSDIGINKKDTNNEIEPVV